MSSATPPIPGLLSLRLRDFTIRHSSFAASFGLVMAGGMKWASHGITFAPGAEAFEASFVQWVIGGGLALSAMSAIILTRRYLWVRKVLTQGVTVRGTVVILESWDAGGKKDSTGRSQRNIAYYATIRYEMHGRGRQARIKLPHAGSHFGLKKGGETHLLVHDSAPDSPLISSLYLGPI